MSKNFIENLCASPTRSGPTNCAVRPGGARNTGIYGSGATKVGISVGGTSILSCQASGVTVAGELIVTDGVRVGSSGTMTTKQISGGATRQMQALKPAATTSFVLNFGSRFSTIPIIIITNNGGTVSPSDILLVTADNVTPTSATIHIRNTSASITTTPGKITIGYIVLN